MFAMQWPMSQVQCKARVFMSHRALQPHSSPFPAQLQILVRQSPQRTTDNHHSDIIVIMNESMGLV